jgi:2-methylcitrate dehydratase PrpD
VTTSEQRLAEFAAGMTFEQLPPAVVAALKRLLLDSVGVALAGSTAPGVDAVLGAVRSWGGGGGSVYAAGVQVAPPFAALANGVMSTARDFDDTLDDAMLHTQPSVLPAALALAEARGASGRDLLTAVAVGTELLCRMGRARRRPQEFLPTGTLAGMAAAAAAARVLGLDAARLLDACGVAYSACAGNVQPLHEGRLVKRYHAGFAARTGVVSAELAARGLTGAARYLEGDHGYYHLYERGDYEPAVLTEDLGARWHLLDLSLKPYPSARDHHGVVEAAITLAQRHDLRVDDVDAVEVWLPPNPFGVSGRPLGTLGGDPVVEAIISAAYCVASALLRRRQVLDDFTPEGVADPQVQELARRVRVLVHPHVVDPVTFVPQRLVVTLTGGKALTVDVPVLRGHPARPLGDAELTAKFRACLAFAAAPVSPRTAQAIVAAVDGLDAAADAGQLARLLSLAPVPAAGGER